MGVSESDALDRAGAELSKGLAKSILERWFIWFGDGPDSRGELQQLTDEAARRWPGTGLMARAPAPAAPPADDYDAVKDAIYGEDPPEAPADDLDDMLG